MSGTIGGYKLTKLHMINIGGGVLMAIGSALAIAQATAPKPGTPLCELRYASGVLFSLSRPTGAPLQPEDLQARLGGLDWGITSNTKIVKDEAVPHGYALEIAVKRAGTAPEDDQERAGMGFTWLPRQLAVASAACLSYSFWVPADFKLGDGGTLPGFVSDATSEQSGQDAEQADEPKPAPKLQPFSLRPQWRQDGRFWVAQTFSNGQTSQIQIDPVKARMKPGQWVRIEEEVVLNTPGRNNGVLRVWIDRQLVVERGDLAYRKDDMQSFQGVTGDTHYIRNGAWVQPPATTTIKLSPLELRLR